MESCMLGHEIWKVTCGENTEPPVNAMSKMKWNATSQALYALKQCVHDDVLI